VRWIKHFPLKNNSQTYIKANSYYRIIQRLATLFKIIIIYCIKMINRAYSKLEINSKLGRKEIWVNNTKGKTKFSLKNYSKYNSRNNDRSCRKINKIYLNKSLLSVRLQLKAISKHFKASHTSSLLNLLFIWKINAPSFIWTWIKRSIIYNCCWNLFNQSKSH